jgi:hypothetical protein
MKKSSIVFIGAAIALIVILFVFNPGRKNVQSQIEPAATNVEVAAAQPAAAPSGTTLESHATVQFDNSK